MSSSAGNAQAIPGNGGGAQPSSPKPPSLLNRISDKFKVRFFFCFEFVMCALKMFIFFILTCFSFFEFRLVIRS